jgi:hypothetical protein
MACTQSVGDLALLRAEVCKHCRKDDYAPQGPRQMFLCDCCQIGAVRADLAARKRDWPAKLCQRTAALRKQSHLECEERALGASLSNVEAYSWFCCPVCPDVLVQYVILEHTLLPSRRLLTVVCTHDCPGVRSGTIASVAAAIASLSGRSVDGEARVLLKVYQQLAAQEGQRRALDDGYSFEVAARHDKSYKGADELLPRLLLPRAWPSPPSCCQLGPRSLRQRHSGRWV